MVKNDARIEPGTPVFVVQRRVNKTIRDMGCYMYAAQVEGFFILVPFSKEYTDVRDWLGWAALDIKVRGYATLMVVPVSDCYLDKADAERAIEKELWSHEEQIAALWPEEAEESGLLEDA